MGGREFAMTIKGGTMKRDELYAKYIGVMNINTVLKQQNAELLEALKDIANTELISDELITIAKDAIAKVEGKT